MLSEDEEVLHKLGPGVELHPTMEDSLGEIDPHPEGMFNTAIFSVVSTITGRRGRVTVMGKDTEFSPYPTLPISHSTQVFSPITMSDAVCQQQKITHPLR